MSRQRRREQRERTGAEPLRRITHRVAIIAHDTDGKPGLSIQAPGVNIEHLCQMLEIALASAQDERRKAQGKIIVPAGFQMPQDERKKMETALAN